MKWIFASAAALLALSLCLSSCGGGNNTEDNPKKTGENGDGGKKVPTSDKPAKDPELDKSGESGMSPYKEWYAKNHLKVVSIKAESVPRKDSIEPKNDIVFLIELENTGDESIAYVGYSLQYLDTEGKIANTISLPWFENLAAKSKLTCPPFTDTIPPEGWTKDFKYNLKVEGIQFK